MEADRIKRSSVFCPSDWSDGQNSRGEQRLDKRLNSLEKKLKTVDEIPNVNLKK